MRVTALCATLFVLLTVCLVACAVPATCKGGVCSCGDEFSPDELVLDIEPGDCECPPGKDCNCYNEGNCFCGSASNCACNFATCYCDNAATCSGMNVMYCKKPALSGDPNCNHFKPGRYQTYARDIAPFCLANPSNESSVPTCTSYYSRESVPIPGSESDRVSFSCYSSYFCANNSKIDFAQHPEYLINVIMGPIWLLFAGIIVLVLCPKCRAARAYQPRPAPADYDKSMEDWNMTTYGSFLIIAYCFPLPVAAIVLWALGPSTYPYGFIPMWLSLYLFMLMGPLSIRISPRDNEFRLTSWYCCCIPWPRYRFPLSVLTSCSVQTTYTRTKNGGMSEASSYLRMSRTEGGDISINVGQCWCGDLCAMGCNKNRLGEILPIIEKYNKIPPRENGSVLGFYRGVEIQRAPPQQPGMAGLFYAANHPGAAAPASAPYAPPPAPGDGAPPAYNQAVNNEAAAPVNFCNQCGTKQKPDAKFCSACGHNNAA